MMRPILKEANVDYTLTDGNTICRELTGNI